MTALGILAQHIGPEHPLRAQVEAGIAAAYARAYGARLTGYPDRLLCVFDEAGRPACAAGLRTAAEGFFSDHYADAPLTTRLSPGPVVEVGPLAALSAGASRRLVGHVIALCLGAGAEWAVFTATRELRHLLARRGLPFRDLGPAERDRVPSPESWGSYYRHDPRVCAVSRRDLENR